MSTTVIGKRSVLIQKDHIAVLVWMDTTEMANSVKVRESFRFIYVILYINRDKA